MARPFSENLTCEVVRVLVSVKLLDFCAECSLLRIAVVPDSPRFGTRPSRFGRTVQQGDERAAQYGQAGVMPCDAIFIVA